MSDHALRFPIGKFEARETYSGQETAANLQKIEELPAKIETAYHLLQPSLLDKPYREGGWTARQVIHHLADSHLNAYIRTKWTLTEDTPLIKAYNEKAWAETPEVNADPHISIELLEALHKKWVLLLRELQPSDLQKSFLHPETNKHVPLDRMIALYAWHGEHHLAHLNLILNSEF
jgi:hypothetical protein